MQIVVTFFCVLLIGVSSHQWGPNKLKCLEELHLSKAIIDKVYDPWTKLSPENNAMLNSFLECDWKKEEILNSRGQINWNKVDESLLKGAKDNMENSKADLDKANVIFAMKILKMAYNNCREQNIQGSTPGQTVVKIQNCVTRQLTKFKTPHCD